MSSVDLLSEYQSALGETSFDDLGPLLAAGASGRGIASAAPAFTRVSVSGGRYQPDPGGGLAYVVPVRVGDPFGPETIDPAGAISEGGIVDLLAFHPRHKNRWALRVGAAEWLGAVEPQFIGPLAVRVWRTPFDWLKADCDGIALLTRDRPGQYRILSSLRRIIAEDAEHAAELRRVLAHPWSSPPVLIANRQRKARYAA